MLSGIARLRRLDAIWAALLFVGVCVGNPRQLVAGSPGGSCQSSVKHTKAELVDCIRDSQLWRALAAFQNIADRNPGPDGHGNRNTGTRGYEASVEYVARFMREAGYHVAIQPYPWTRFSVAGIPQFATAVHSYKLSRDWFVARLSGSGALSAMVEPAGGAAGGEAADGCSPDDFATFAPGHIALVQRGTCSADAQVANAEAAGAVGLAIYNGENVPPGKGEPPGDGAFQLKLIDPAGIPVVGLSYAAGNDLYRQYKSAVAPIVRLDIQTRRLSGTDFNLIADSPYGDPGRVVVVDAHLDSIYGAGMLDNASGSTTILEIARQMAKTPTSNQLRYIWFGGEELGLLGSHYYTTHLDAEELKKIVFNIDVDVTATPNFALLVADPAHAWNVDRFPPNVVAQSQIGNEDFAAYFRSIGVESRNGNNNGTDSNSFSLIGVPDSGIYTQQDCCKSALQVKLWGGFRGNYEGSIPSFNGGCVDQPHRWCDNLSNNDRFVLGLVSKAVASVVFELANDTALPSRSPPS